MKKLFKSLLLVGCVGVLSAGIAATAACSNDGGSDGVSQKKGDAYGLVHGAGYVGYASITYTGDKVDDAYLTEVCLPTQVKATEASDDVITIEGTNNKGETTYTYYYKTVKYGSVTLTYKAAEGNNAEGYYVGTDALVTYFQSEANCKAYYDAVKGGNVSVVVGGSENKTIMTWDALCKEKNGYGGTTFDWKKNVDATVNYVKAHGVSDILNLTLVNKDWTDTNGVATGASWTDMNTRKANTYSYAELFVKAYVQAK